MQKKHLAVISYHTCPLSDEADAEIGGMNVYVLELSKELAKAGCSIDIFTRSQSPDSPRVVQVSPTLRVIHLPAGEEAPIGKKSLIGYIPDFLESFYAFVKQERLRYDVVSCHYYLSGLIGLEIKKTFHIPMLITFHTLGLMKNLVARSEEERESTDRIKAELLLVQLADKVVATSETDAEYIRTLYNGHPNNIIVLKPGLNLDLFYPSSKEEARKKIGAPKDQKLLLFVGRIEPLKGIDVLLYAIKVLLNTNPEMKVCVWIVGGDISKPSEEWPNELKKLSEIRTLLDISASVTFVGRKEQEELPNYYNAADLLVMPSHYESFGITAVEAMACGVPVITTDVTGVSDLFDKQLNILVTSANNPILLAEKINQLLNDTTTYEKASRKVTEYVRNISWKNTADQFVALCARCSESAKSK